MAATNNNNEHFLLSNCSMSKAKVWLHQFYTAFYVVHLRKSNRKQLLLSLVVAQELALMITQALAVNGAKVYVVGRTKEKLDRVAEIYGKDIDAR